MLLQGLLRLSPAAVVAPPASDFLELSEELLPDSSLSSSSSFLPFFLLDAAPFLVCSVDAPFFGYLLAPIFDPPVVSNLLLLSGRLLPVSALEPLCKSSLELSDSSED